MATVATPKSIGHFASYVMEQLKATEEKLLEVNAERKRIEDSLIASEKIAIVGRLLSTVMHEINNPLDAVGLNLYLIESNPSTSAELQQYAKAARQSLDQAVSIAKNTLSFVRESSALTPVGLSQVMNSVLELYARRIQRHSVVVNTHFDDKVQVCGFPGELRQLFANIVRNALDAIGDDGRLDITIQPTTGDDQRNGVKITIADSGPGVPADVQSMLGTAFFTTKGVEGTGLGLWICSEIVKKHKGVLRVHNAPTGGAVFSIFLPCEVTAEIVPINEVRNVA